MGDQYQVLIRLVKCEEEVYVRKNEGEMLSYVIMWHTPVKFERSMMGQSVNY